MKTTEQLRQELERDRSEKRTQLLSELKELEPRKPELSIARTLLEQKRLQQIVNGTPETTAIDELAKILPTIFAASVITSALRWLGGIPFGPILWIRKGQVVKAFPVFQAMRIVRKHKWVYVDTEPKKPKQKINRWEALKILIRGNNR